MPVVQALQTPRHGIQAINADGFQMITKHGLNTALPAAFNGELFGNARARGKTCGGQPLAGLAVTLAQRHLL